MEKDKDIFLSVVIPAYNEENRIPETLCLIDRYLKDKGFSYEIIVVDDGSKDNTVEVVGGFSKTNNRIKLLKNKVNRGKGFTVKKGVLESRGEYVLFSDADLATPIEEFGKLFGYLRDGYDIVIGSRKMKDSGVIVTVPWYRKMIARLGYFLVWSIVLSGRMIHDTQCGFKLFKRETAKHIFSKQRLDGGMFDVEIIYIAIKNRFNLKEIPVIWSHKKGSNINILKCILFDPVDLLKVRLNSFFRRY